MRFGLGALALLALSGCAQAHRIDAEATPPGVLLQPGHYADIGPRWSHDGKRIAFLRATTDRQHQLYVMDAEEQRPLALLEPELIRPDRPYAPSLCRYASPDTLAWSPSDRQIAFERIEWFVFENGERLAGTSLWAINTVSGRVTPLAVHSKRYSNFFYYFHSPHWSPDSRYLAFIGEGINGQRALFIRPLAAQNAQEVLPCFDNYEDSDWLAWEPYRANASLKRIQPALAFRRGLRRVPSVPEIETLRRLQPGNSDGTHSGVFWRMTAADYARLTPKTAADTESGPPALHASHLAWSPDGKRLAFSLTPDPNDFTRYELWVIGRDGREAQRVTPKDGHGYFAPVWIGNARLGALSPHEDRFDVVTVSLSEAGTVRKLGVIGSADCDWSPDRRQIVYAGPPSKTAPNSDDPTTLRFFSTGLK